VVVCCEVCVACEVDPSPVLPPLSVAVTPPVPPPQPTSTLKNINEVRPNPFIPRMTAG
jgi:hypothetical protein